MKTKEPIPEAKSKNKWKTPKSHCNFRYFIEREIPLSLFIRGAVSTFTFERENLSLHNFDISPKPGKKTFLSLFF
jgi:hypothetical protein